MEFTILMPCLNESKTLALCIDEANEYIKRTGLDAEILIADNGSTDGSVDIAREHGARVVHIEDKGYGNALIGGIKEAAGKYIIMGDCDGSYDFSDLDGFVEKLREGAKLVMGNRYTKDMEKGAMSFSHKYIGVPVLSYLGRVKYNVKVKDFHCGIRGFDRSTAKKLNFKSGGMEFATEMIGEFSKNGYRIDEIPIHFRKDKRGTSSHLRSIPDGIRHLRYIQKDVVKPRPVSYVITGFIALAIMVALLFLSILIPRSAISDNMLKSSEYLAAYGMNLYPMQIENEPQTKLDIYADSMLLGIIWQQDRNKPVESLMYSSYYDGPDIVNRDLYAAVTKDESANQEYLRYWHGSVVIVRPLLAFFDINQMFIIMALILLVLLVILMHLLVKHKNYATVIAFIFGLVGVGVWYVPFSLEYTWMFLIMMVASIVIAKSVYKGNYILLPKYFMVIGMVTAFMDFLTTETITLTVPLIMACYIINREKYLDSRKNFIQAAKCSALWIAGYGLMWASKWIIASITLGINAFKYVGGSIDERIGGDIGISLGEYLSGSITKNISCLFPLGYGAAGFYAALVLLAIFAYFAYVHRKKTVDKRYIALLLIIAVIPYIRYLVLHNHSYIHHFFTFRAQMVTLMAAIYYLEETIDKKHFKLKSK